MNPGLVSFVTVKRLDRLTVTPEDILHDFAGVIALLRFIASSPDISRELWLRTPHGAWRFFRILDNGILELDRDGRALAPAGKGPAVVPAVGAGAVKKVKEVVPDAKEKYGKNGRGPAGKNRLPDSVPAKDTDGVLTAARELETKKDPKSFVITEKNAEPVKDPGPAKDFVPASLEPKNPEPENDLKHTSLPEKSVALSQDLGPAADPAQPPEPEKVPEVIQKFLKRRKKGLEKDPGSE